VAIQADLCYRKDNAIFSNYSSEATLMYTPKWNLKNIIKKHFSPT